MANKSGRCCNKTFEMATCYFTKFWMTCSFLLMSGGVLAAGDISNPGEQNVRLVMTKDTGAELQLEVRQAPLTKVLNSISNKTGLRINYSVLPDGLVTATCVGSTVKQVMECLLVRKADLVFRYSQQPSKTDPQGQPVEAWVLGAKFGADQTNSIVCSLPGTQQQTLQTAATPKTEPEQPDETDELVKMATSKVPAQRAEAIGRLMAGGRKGDVTVRETLEAALSDQDASVRVRAISSLAHREGAAAVAPALQEALHDSDSSVRLTAVDNAGNDVALLKQALTDSDATVRQLAGIRLEPLLKTGNAE
jgi:hypothetical protein